MGETEPTHTIVDGEGEKGETPRRGGSPRRAALCLQEKADALFGKGASPRFARLPEPRNHPPVSLCQNTWNPPISSSPLAAICKQRRIKTTLPTISR